MKGSETRTEMAEMAESRWKDQKARRRLEIRRKELSVDSEAV